MANNDPDVIIDKCEHYDGSFDEEDEEEHEERREEEEYYDDEEYYEDNTDTGASKQENTGKAKRRLADRKRFRTCVVSLLVLILVLVLGAITVIALWVTGVVGASTADTGPTTAQASATTTATATTLPTTPAPATLIKGDRRIKIYLLLLYKQFQF